MSALASRLVVSAALFVGGCSYATSSSNADPKLSGELWYVRTDLFLGIPVSSSVYYCPPPTAGAAECLQAHMSERSDPGAVAPREAPPSATTEAEDDPDASIFWPVVTKAKGAEACAEVHAVLAKDEACSGEQCRAPLALAGVHVARCATDDPEIEAVRALQKSWKAQVKGAPDTCFRALLRLARSRAEEVGRRYGAQCLASRPPNEIERALTPKGPSGDDSKEPAAK